MSAGTLIFIGIIAGALAAMALLGRRTPSGFSSRLHSLGPTKLQDPSPGCPVGDLETTLGDQVPDVQTAQHETAGAKRCAGS